MSTPIPSSRFAGMKHSNKVWAICCLNTEHISFLHYIVAQGNCMSSFDERMVPVQSSESGSALKIVLVITCTRKDVRAGDKRWEYNSFAWTSRPVQINCIPSVAHKSPKFCYSPTVQYSKQAIGKVHCFSSFHVLLLVNYICWNNYRTALRLEKRWKESMMALKFLALMQWVHFTNDTIFTMLMRVKHWAYFIPVNQLAVRLQS